MKLAIAADHAGYEYKEILKTILAQAGHAVKDFGTFTAQPCDYPDFALSAARAVAAGTVERAVMVCGTGIGMSLTANKVPGIRAAVLMDPVTARTSRSHNDVNVACFGARLQNLDDVKALLRIWLETAFEGGRHAVRLDKIRQIERHSC